MPTTTATITGNVADVVGEAFSDSRIRVIVESSESIGEGTVAGGVRLNPDYPVTLDADGDFSVTLPVTSGGSPLYQLRFEGHSNADVRREVLGWFDLTANDTLDAIRDRTFVPAVVTPTLVADVTAAAASVMREQSNGVAGLDGTGKLFASRIPDLTGTYAGVLTATTGNEAATVNAYLAAASPIGAKRLVGAFTIASTVTVPNNTYLDLSAATITHTGSAQTAITVGSDATVLGGKITSPATWNGTNSAWTYAVIEVTGNGSAVIGTKLSNVPRVGIGVRGDDTRIANCHITGNYPTGQWTGVETVHFGIGLDPSATATAGNLTVTGNIIESCVQGVFTGPYDGGGPAKGVTITGNTFEGCWNHGIYLYGEGGVVSGNAFNRCQIPVATSGPRMAVTGNSMYSGVGGTDQRDISGISCREAIGCVVANNTIRGNAPAGSVIIDIRCSDTVVCNDNIVHNNTIDVDGGTSQAIRVGINATTCENNAIHHNVIRSVGGPNLGIIHMTAAGSGSLGKDNRVCDNTVVMKGDTHGIYLTSQDGCVVAGNKVRLEYDAPSAKTLGMVAINSNSLRTEVRHNNFRVTAAWGTNVTLRAVYEFSGVTTNLYRDNVWNLDATKLAAAVPMFLQGGSRIHEQGTGAPGLAAEVGSTWRRTDGGAATTFYVKESGTSSAGWVGK